MKTKTLFALSEEMKKAAKLRAVELDISLAEFFRRAISRELKLYSNDQQNCAKN